MFDWSGLLLNPNYLINGVDAVLYVGGASVGDPVRAIDKSAGVELSDLGIATHSIKPAATIRRKELISLGIEPSDLEGGDLEMNGYTWRIESWHARPSPQGELAGEVYLFLTDATPIEVPT